MSSRRPFWYSSKSNTHIRREKSSFPTATKKQKQTAAIMEPNLSKALENKQYRVHHQQGRGFQ